MIVLLSLLIAAGVILSIFTGPIGLLLAVPAAAGLFFVLRSRQPQTAVDPRFREGAQPDMRVAAQRERTPDDVP